MPRRGEASRQAIRDAVRATPGIHLAALTRATGFSWSTVAYHVRMMQRGGELRTVRNKRETRVFDASIDARHLSWLGALHQDLDAPIMQALTQSEHTVPMLHARLGISSKLLRRRLATLAAEGLVRKEGHFNSSYAVEASARRDVLEHLLPGAPVQAPPFRP